MFLELVARCIDMAAFCGADTVLLIGGEPLLHPELCEIIDCVHERGLRVIIVSNGLRLSSQSFATKILHHLADDDEISISLKGFDDEDYLANCGQTGGFTTLQKAISNIESVGANYALSYVVSESNLELIKTGLSSIYEQFHRPLSLSFCSPCFTGEIFEEHTTPENQAILASRTLEELAFLHAGAISVHINAPLCHINEKLMGDSLEYASLMTGCHVLNQSGIIFDTNGDFLMCNHLASLPIGVLDCDYSTSAEFEAFLHSKKVADAWSAFARLPYAKCARCEKLMLCGGGCPLLFY